MKVLRKPVLFVLAPAMLVLVAIALVSLSSGIAMPRFTRDVTAIAGVHPLTGVLSNLGILLWCVSASVCLFTAATLWAKRETRSFLFLLASGLLSTYLLFDDAFLFHERLAAMYFGIDERLVFAALGAAVVIYLIAFAKDILSTDYSFLFFALVFLSLSVVIDIMPETILRHFGQWQFFLEDGAKWLGIASWSGYFLDTCFRLVVPAPAFPENGRPPLAS